MSTDLSQLTRPTIAELGPLLRAGEVSSTAVTRAYLERIGSLDPLLNTYITVTADSALRQAEEADGEIARGRYRGPLHGVPMGLKDLFDVAGVPTTFGSAILRNNVPSTDATVTRRLREAGAVLLGKQQMHEFAFGTTGENPHDGPAHNPWDTERVTGGSSSGTGAAVAAELCAAGLGSDTGGSIRMPASLCGIVGLKPTYGRVSRAGVLPLSWSLDHVGPLARCVADAALVLEAIAGPDPSDPSAAPLPVPSYSQEMAGGVAGMRLGVPTNYFFEQIDPAVAETVRAAIDLLHTLGAEIVDVALPNLAPAQAVGTAIMAPEAAAWHAEWLRTQPEQYGADVLLRLRGGAVTLATDYLKAQRLRALIQLDFAAAFNQVDALLTPTTPVIAPRIGATMQAGEGVDAAPRSILGRLTVPADLAGIPAINVPCGFVRGMPVGLQVMGPSFGESTVLRVAHAYESATAWHTHQPPLDLEELESQ